MPWYLQRGGGTYCDHNDVMSKPFFAVGCEEHLRHLFVFPDRVDVLRAGFSVEYLFVPGHYLAFSRSTIVFLEDCAHNEMSCV